MCLGRYFAVESRENWDKTKLIASIYFTDYTSSNILKIIADVTKDDQMEIVSKLKKGCTILVKGEAQYDKWLKDTTIKPRDIMMVKKKKKVDKAEEKRVELHVHTNMSAMDGITPAEQLVKTAFEWGHKAIAITDHGVVQAFPKAMQAVEEIWDKGGDFKIIYGVEGYFVNDMVEIVSGKDDVSLDGEFIVFDTETTGLNSLQRPVD